MAFPQSSTIEIGHGLTVRTSVRAAAPAAWSSKPASRASLERWDNEGGAMPVDRVAEAFSPASAWNRSGGLHWLRKLPGDRRQ